MVLLSSDRSLLDRFRQGERQALSRVYAEYAPALGAFLSRGFVFSSKGRTLHFAGYKSPADLENALQETFVRAFSVQARQAYDGLSSYRNYLMAIARNHTMSELRRREVTWSALVKEDQGEGGSPLEEQRQAERDEPSGEEQLLHQELEQLYAQFVSGLDRQQQLFFKARFEAQQTQVEAGRAAGISHMQARTMEKRLRQRFLAYLQHRGYLETYGRAQAAGGGAG